MGCALPQRRQRPAYAYQGRERDETGLIYYRARYYDPSALAGAVGRFVSRDPIGYAGGLNPYAAFDNDPINLGDPSGTTAMARGIQGLINQSYYDNVASAFGFTAPSSGSQSLATVNYRPSVYAQSSTANLQTALNVASAIPFIGSVASLGSAGLAIAEGDAVGAVLGVAGAIPGVGSAKAAVRGADLLLDAARVEGAFSRETTTVGRWMSQTEFKTMNETGRVVEGAGGRTYVVNPADPSAFKGAGRGSSVYAEFDVPTSVLRPGSKPEWSVIPGPNVTTRLYGPAPTELAPATCIICVIGKP